MAEAASNPSGNSFDIKRLILLLGGVGIFFAVYFSPAWGAAVDPMGAEFELTREGKGAIALFLLAGLWWVFEVVPIGVTSLLIGIVQALFLIRPADDAFRDFMTPSVMFIFASIVIGFVFTKTGLTKRLAYRMLTIVGEKTSRIYLGVFVVTAALTHIMAHTAVAATIYPLLVAIYSLYGEGEKPTKFGRGLFMGMAYVAGAGSIVTLLGAARGAVALDFYMGIEGTEVGFFELTLYMAPIGWLMVILLWVYFMIVCKPEKSEIPGLRERAKKLHKALGPVSGREWTSLIIVFICILALALPSFVPELKPYMNKAAVLLISTVLFFVFKILDISDLERIPWNIILLFGGAMSIGFCLWDTGAAQWMAVKWFVVFKDASAFVFILGMAFFVMVMTNFIMNVAAIAISLPVALVLAPYLGVGGEVILFSSLVVAGMPFLLLVGAAPNAIAYDSKQFTSGQFFLYGLPASLILMLVVALAVGVIWPLMGMDVTVPVP